MNGNVSKLLLVVGALFLYSAILSGQTYTSSPTLQNSGLSPTPSAEYLLSNTSEGREYWLCFPQSDIGLPNRIRLYITSRFRTKVTIKSASGLSIAERTIQPYTPETIDAFDGVGSSWELTQPGIITRQGIHIVSEEPITVYGMSSISNQLSLDAYRAIPVEALGRRYVHVGYYDFNPFPAGGSAGIVATEDNTTVRINVRGRGADTPDGFLAGSNTRIGQTITIRLNRGETYLLRGSGLSRGVFDFTGTEITANRPIAVVSGHQRTALPSWSTPTGNRDFLMEMMPPVETWGKTYVSSELSTSNNRGDFLRVVASENATTLRVRWWEQSGARRLLRDDQVTLQAGEFWEFNESFSEDPLTRMGVRGTAFFEADKPILVMQYSYSSNVWGGQSNVTPSMSLVPALEQFSVSAMAGIPPMETFPNTTLHLFAIGDTSNMQENIRLLRTIKLNGIPILETASAFSGNNIPSTELFWTQLTLREPLVSLEGETPFSAYVQGTGGAGGIVSYIAPLASSLNKIDILDTLPPVVNAIDSCGIVFVNVTELRNAPGSTPQIDQGLRSIDPVLLDNFRIVFPRAGRFNPTDSVVRFSFSLEAIDGESPAIAIIRSSDRAGNISLDTIHYQPETLAAQEMVIEFPPTPLSDESTQEVQLLNLSGSPVNLLSLSVESDEHFSIVSPASFPVLVAAGDSLAVHIRFAPTGGGTLATDIIGEFSCGSRTLLALEGSILITFVDTLPPVLTATFADCDSVIFVATEERSETGSTTGTPQIDQGIISIELEESRNLLVRLEGAEPTPDNPRSRVEFSIARVNTTRSAFGVLRISDKEGNTTLDTMRLQPTAITTYQDQIWFDGVGAEIVSTVFVNLSDETIRIDSFRLSVDKPSFRLLSPTTASIIEPGDSVECVFAFDIRLLTEGRSYFDTLSAFFSCGNVEVARYFLNDPTMSVSEQSADKSILGKIVPQPSHSRSEVHFTLAEAGYTSVVLFGTTGQLVEEVLGEYLSSGTHILPLPVRSLSAGTYFLKITSGSNRFVLPVIIVR